MGKVNGSVTQLSPLQRTAEECAFCTLYQLFKAYLHDNKSHKIGQSREQSVKRNRPSDNREMLGLPKRPSVAMAARCRSTHLRASSLESEEGEMRVAETRRQAGETHSGMHVVKERVNESKATHWKSHKSKHRLKNRKK